MVDQPDTGAIRAEAVDRLIRIDCANKTCPTCRVFHTIVALCDALDECRGERDAALGAISKLLLWESDMVLALLAIERESEGHGDLNSPTYDMTLDHICELAAGARQGEGLPEYSPSELAAIEKARQGDG